MEFFDQDTEYTEFPVKVLCPYSGQEMEFKSQKDVEEYRVHYDSLTEFYSSDGDF